MNWHRRVIASVGTEVDVNRSQRIGGLWGKDGRQLGPADSIVVYHATDDQTADQMVISGVKMGTKVKRPPTIIQDEEAARLLKKNVGDMLDYEPGRGQGAGLYVAPDSRHLSQYGKAVVSIRIQVSDLRSPPERANVNAIKCLLLEDGYVEKAIAPHDISRVQ